MDWYLGQSRDVERVEADLRAAGVPVYVPRYTYEFWDGRRSVVNRGSALLLPGYLLIGTCNIPSGATRHDFQVIVSRSTGRPVRAPDAQLFIDRCDRGDFNISHRSPHVSVGTRVIVAALNIIGTVTRVRSRREYEVTTTYGRSVIVGQPGLVPV